MAEWLPQLVWALTERLHPLLEWAHELLGGRESHSLGRSGWSQPVRVHSFCSAFPSRLLHANRRYDATQKTPVHLIMPYSPECVELDFSHFAAYQTASANGSMNALRLFAGCPRPPTREKSQSFTQRECIRLLLVRSRSRFRSGHSAQKASPKGIIGLEASESSPFRSAVTFVAKIRAEQEAGALRSLSLSGWLRSDPTPSALKWLKSSVERLSEKGVSGIDSLL